MSQFRFKLEAVLQWRELQKTQEEEALARLLAYRSRLESKLAELRQRRMSTTQDHLDKPGMRGGDFRTVAAYLVGLDGELSARKHELASLEKAVVDQRARCAAAEARAEIVRVLKRDQASEWRSREDAQLETIAAESYLAQWNRGNRAAPSSKKSIIEKS